MKKFTDFYPLTENCFQFLSDGSVKRVRVWIIMIVIMTVNQKGIKNTNYYCLDSWYAFEFAVIQEMAMVIL